MSETVDKSASEPSVAAPPRGRAGPLKRWLWWPLRNGWRSLTSMRTALVLLFLLAVAAIPGALLPQRDLNESRTLDYIEQQGTLGEWMDRLQLFDVFSSIWFSSIYGLLFVSLVGCLTPRIFDHLRSLRAELVPVPRKLSRMPHHVETTVEMDSDEAARRIEKNLKGWRRKVTIRPTDATNPSGAVEVSAEKGYLREFGNLIFHFSLLALLVTIALGSLFGYEGTRSLIANGEQGLCTSSTAVYDSFRAGSLVDGTDLNELCLQIDEFRADFLPSGQPASYESDVRWTDETPAPPLDEWESALIKVNEPLRAAGDRAYVLGNGFAPTFTVTFPNGEVRTQTVIFIPDDLQTMMSSGIARFDTPGGMYPDEDERRQNQIALEGIFAPTGQLDGALLTSTFPVPHNPYVALNVYKGDTGLDTGMPQNAYTLDPDLIEQGRLNQVDQVNMGPGESTTLPDGTEVSFDGFERWVSVQISHDPAQNWTLASAMVMLAGLLVSMLVPRRRVWARITPAGQDGRSVVEIAGLARTDQAGWGENFTTMAHQLLDEDDTKSRSRGRRL